MSKVEVISNWGYFDSLDGKELVASDVVRLKWPDGSESDHCVHIRSWSVEIRDMGSPDLIMDLWMLAHVES